MNNEIDLAYAAGVIDGEGCISLSKTAFSYSLQLSVHNTDKRLIDWLQFKFGGGVYDHVPANGKRKKTYAWTITGSAVKPILVEVLRYLIVKKEEAKLALDFPIGQVGCKHSKNEKLVREDIYNKLKECKGR